LDIVQLLTAALRESATAALALFAIWSVKQLYEQRLQERDDHAAQRLQERDDYVARLENINQVLVVRLEEGNKALAVSTEVVRQNTQVLQSLQQWLTDKK